MATGDDKQDPTSTTEVPSSHEVPGIEVDLGSPLNIPGTDVVVSAADFGMERAPGFGLSLFKDLPPLPVPDEDDGQDAPNAQLTQGHPSPKGGMSVLFFILMLTLVAC